MPALDCAKRIRIRTAGPGRRTPPIGGRAYGISISVQYLLSVAMTSANAWNVTGLSR